MKTEYIHTILLLLLSHSLVFLSSCSGDDELTGFVPAKQTLTIVKNDLLFPSQGSTATVEVRTDEALTAHTDAPWATATVSGQTVSVTAQPNTSYEGRTAMLTLSTPTATRQLPLQQRGVIVGTMPMDSYAATMQGGSLTMTISHDMPMTFVAGEDWIHATMQGDVLTVTVDACSEGHLRRGRLVSECNQLRDTLAIVQYDMDTDVVGSYYLMGYNGGTGGVPVAMRFTVEQRNGALFMTWPTQEQWKDASIPLAFDAASCTITFPSAMHLYDNGGNYDRAYFYDTEGIIAVSDSRGALARLDYSNETGAVASVLTAANWPGHELAGFIIRSVRANGLVQNTLAQIASPAIMKITEL